MKQSVIAAYCVASCVFVLLFCAAPLYAGGCLTDGDTSHTQADWNQRLWSYSSANPVAPSTSADLKFITFNIQSGFHTNCVNNVTAQALLMRTADYTGNQEAVQGVDTRCSKCLIPKVVADVAGFSTRFVMAMPYRTGQYGTNVGSSQTILDTKYIVMTNTVGREPRVAVAIKTAPPALKGRFLWYVNVHVEYYDPALRQQQVQQVIDFIQSDILAADPKAVIVAGGDFNGGPWDAMYTKMKNAGYKNTWEVFNGGSIEGGNTIPADWPGSRFDHIFYRVPSDVYATVKNVIVHDVRMSDHRPMTATINFQVTPPAEATTKPATTAPTSAPTTKPATSAPSATSAPTAKAATSAPTASPTAAPSGSQRVCVGPIFENQQVTISCSNPAHKVREVQYANYGFTSGSCGAYVKGTCIGGSSEAVVIDKCVGENSCTFLVSNNVFGDPCPRSGKSFFTQVICS